MPREEWMDDDLEWFRNKSYDELRQHLAGAKRELERESHNRQRADGINWQKRYEYRVNILTQLIEQKGG